VTGPSKDARGKRDRHGEPLFDLALPGAVEAKKGSPRLHLFKSVKKRSREEEGRQGHDHESNSLLAGPAHEKKPQRALRPFKGNVPADGKVLAVRRGWSCQLPRGERLLGARQEAATYYTS